MSYDEYYCTNCNAILNDQPGFDPDKGTWVCTKCGHMMMADDVYRGDKFEGVAWFCDDCGALLNRQAGFTDSCGSWRCTECGHVNGTTDDDIIKYKCPSCYSPLDIQYGFSEYSLDWSCTKCGAHLHRDYGSDEYKEIEDNYSSNERTSVLGNNVGSLEHLCPSCGADLEEQDDYDADEDEWTCTECGAHLHHDYSDDEYEVVSGGKTKDNAVSLHSYSRYAPAYSVSESPQPERKQKARTSKSLAERIEDLVDAIKGLFSVLLGLLFLAGCIYVIAVVVPKQMHDSFKDNPEEHPGEIRIEYSASHYKRKNYYDTIIELRDRGFSDFRITPLNDLKTGIISKEGTIKTIEINGKSDFQYNTLVSEQSVVSITYHSFAKKEKNGFMPEKNNHLIIYGIDIQLPNYLIEDSVNDKQAVYHVKNDDETHFLFFNSDEQVINEIEKFDTYYMNDIRETSSYDFVEKEIDVLGKKNDKVYSVSISKLELKAQTVYFLLISPDNCKTDYSSDYRAILSGIYVPKDTEIRIDFNLKDYKGKNYEEVVAELKNKGFNNVQGENLQDVFLGVVNKEGKIEKVTINGSSDYKVGDWIDSQAEIVITYHGKK